MIFRLKVEIGTPILSLAAEKLPAFTTAMNNFVALKSTLLSIFGNHVFIFGDSIPFCKG
ncbi:protein of unknown function [Serratia sp. Tan611]|nr:protein of unknown function [Serratia sp. Tan611]